MCIKRAIFRIKVQKWKFIFTNVLFRLKWRENEISLNELIHSYEQRATQIDVISLTLRDLNAKPIKPRDNALMEYFNDGTISYNTNKP